MSKTVADQFADILAAAGTKRIYGIVGDSLNGLTDAIRRQGRIEWIHVSRTELVMPRSITLDMARGVTLYMAKAVMTGRGDEVIDLAKTNLWR